ncbi:hypothetical protein OQJ18_13380 [Fluoribacter dumoffii]|uniref:Uncharacterized protein n=1 Tax=Fluoribacter dumoffii TaxID=463 RepID=A0A377GER1_9GAMM|nr:hypothetical protein [Fluoribacter dumoffii]KTC91291.1 hypothetical protein Ldum_2359 [Fluoribacter dumoffii NY 23]MCW8387542.1 hypothetical protein [Fluoribacter dumoffii]MCW8416913.1 hypothetical protein [Fluoribacter dumoffii]MCW8455247.1 hypothetical protein [Fluoribacter dumoffii]MCW8460676.1 hypothetical protein [Fluoribacter dumoffii]
MDSSSIALRAPLKLEPSSKWIRPNTTYEDFSAKAYDAESIQRRRIESIISTITLQDNKELQIEHLFKLKSPLIQKRNKIIKNPIKLIFSKSKLKDIDAELDKIELEIYRLQSQDTKNNMDIDNLLLHIEKKLSRRNQIFSESSSKA